MERSCESMDKNRIQGAAEQGERARNREALVIKAKRRRSGGCAAQECVLTRGDLALWVKARRGDAEPEVSRGRSRNSHAPGQIRVAPDALIAGCACDLSGLRRRCFCRAGKRSAPAETATREVRSGLRRMRCLPDAPAAYPAYDAAMLSSAAHPPSYTPLRPGELPGESFLQLPPVGEGGRVPRSDLLMPAARHPQIGGVEAVDRDQIRPLAGG